MCLANIENHGRAYSELIISQFHPSLLAFCIFPRFLSSPLFPTFLIFDPNIYPGSLTDGEDTEQSSTILSGEKEEAHLLT